MVIYNKDDKSLEIPNGLGNLSITINEGGGVTPDLTDYATISYVDGEIETINEDLDVLEGRVIDLENNGGSGGGNNIYTYTETEYDNGDEIYSSLSILDYEDIINRFPTQQIVIYNTIGNFKVNIVNVINTGYNNGLFGYYIIDDTEFGIIRYFVDNGVIKYRFEENIYYYYTNFQNNLDVTNLNLGKLTDRVEELENNGGGDVEPLVIEIQTNTINDVLFNNVKITTEQFFQLYNNLINFIKVTAPDGEATLHIIGSQKNHLYFIDGYNEYLYDITYYDFMDLHTLKKKTRFAPYNWVDEIDKRLKTLENKVQELENK